MGDSSSMALFLIFTLILFGAAFGAIYVMSKQDAKIKENQVIITPTPTPRPEPTPPNYINISFREYIINPEEYYNTQADVIGFLVKEEFGDGYFSYVQDDYGNKISLSITKKNLRDIFDRRSKLLYRIEGKFFRRSDGLFIEVSGLSRAERPTK